MLYVHWMHPSTFRRLGDLSCSMVVVVVVVIRECAKKAVTFFIRNYTC